jgi:hypothetical protein
MAATEPPRGALPASTEIQRLLQQLTAAQNADGGWSYKLTETWRGGVSSWTEPTALALIACHAWSIVSESYLRGLQWLVEDQRPDGGWAPNRTVDASTSVTSLALLALLPSKDHHAAAVKATQWTSKQVYTDGFSPALLLARLLHLPPAHAPGSVAWFPGTAGWVIPTAMSILALSQASQVLNLPQLSSLAAQSQAYLLSRRCVDGGWNHGGTNTRSEEANSYPETTGIALLALSSLPPAQLADPLRFGQQLLSSPESLEGLSWLQMGMAANRQETPDPATIGPPRTSRDAALRLLALAVRAGHAGSLIRSGEIS